MVKPSRKTRYGLVGGRARAFLSRSPRKIRQKSGLEQAWKALKGSKTLRKMWLGHE